ncbi:MAG: dephospho-CoA kinase [Clostridia bacterium]|nr:dephospho-CoA kinase [Clostridia bacterium]MBO4886578.1 dephospho-CoA kinase [Clostridia bacterium]MBR4443836.1 dephospho-CoA kinase [Clostridia bacterium]
MDKPYVVGITGGIATGKTAATDFLAEQGALVLDADVESRALTAENGEALPMIREKFGDDVFNEDGTLNRRALGDIVFASEEKRHALEGILHPMIQHSLIQKIRQAGQDGVPFLFLSVPLLFETGMDALCDETWCLTLDPAEQLDRVIERDGLSRSEAEARIKSQMSLEEKASRANVLIRTNRSMDATRAELAGLLRDLRRRNG